MGLNDDQLSSSEHDAIRSRLLSGTKRIKPAGAHRRAIVTTTLAIVIVAALSGGAIGAANFLRMGDASEPIATPTATQTQTPTPTPTSSATPTTTPVPTTPDPAPVSPIALGGDCGAALTAEEASAISGEPVAPSDVLSASDPAVLGGVACAWHREGERWDVLGIAVYPFAVIPPSVQEMVGVVPLCDGGGECAYAERFGDAWVYAWGRTADEVVGLVSMVGPRAASIPGTRLALPANAWKEPDCEALRTFIGDHLGRTDLTPYAGDAQPQGMSWDVLTENGAATWCSSLGEGDGSLLEQIEVLLGPGSAGVDPFALESQGAVRVEVPGAKEAWLVSVTDRPDTAVYAVAEGNVLEVTTRFLDDATLVDLTAAVLARLD
jgi:hypothetical protein